MQAQVAGLRRVGVAGSVWDGVGVPACVATATAAATQRLARL